MISDAAMRYVAHAFQDPEKSAEEVRAILAVDTDLAAVKLRHILSSGYGCGLCFENDLRDAAALPLRDCNHPHI